MDNQDNFEQNLKNYTHLFAQQYKGEIDLSNPKKTKESMKILLKERKGNNFMYIHSKRFSNQIFFSQHIITLVGVFFLALLNRSVISLGYMILLLPFFFTTANYLK